jgi:hypothetical protein
MSGCRSRSSTAARMPSSVLVGGIRMSVTTTSGRSLSTASRSEGRSPQDTTTSMPGWAAKTRATPSRTMTLSSASAIATAIASTQTRSRWSL